MSDDAIKTLNNLLAVCHDGIEGFKTSADKVEEPQIKSYLTNVAGEREQTAAALRAQVTQLGGQPTDSGTTAGGLHRAYTGLKGALGGTSRESILNEVERGEQYALEQFDKALQAGLPAGVDAVVRDQRTAIESSLTRMKALNPAS